MPSYSTPSTNLSTGISTKPVTLVPDGAGIRNRWSSNPDQYVPLSVFFAGTKEPEADPDSLFGLRMPPREKKAAPPKEKKAKGGSTAGKDSKEKSDDDDKKDEKGEKGAQKGQQGPVRSQTAQPRPQQAPQAQAPQQGAQAAPGGKQESMGQRLGRLIDVAKGQSVAHSEMTTTANVPTLPVPIGAGDGRKFLDRPDDDKQKKKKKRRKLSRSLYMLLRQ